MAATALPSAVAFVRPQLGTGVLRRVWTALLESRARAAARELRRHEALIRETALFHAGTGRGSLPFAR